MNNRHKKIHPFKSREEFDAYKATHELDKNTIYLYDLDSQRYLRDIEEEFEQLKEENENLNESIKNSPLCVQCSEAECEIRKLREENEILRHTIHEWQHDCNKKREKLEAIREIADKYSVEYNHTIMVNPYQDFSLILNILNR